MPGEGLVAFSHVIDGTPQLLGQERQRWALTMFVLQPGQGLLAGGMVPETEHRRFREGPRERRMAALGPCCPVAFASGFSGARDEAAIGDDILHAGEPLDSVHLIQQDEAQDVPNARHRLE